MATQTLSQAQVSELEVAFNLFDKDGNGSITSEELRWVMDSLGRKLAQKEVEKMIAEVDADKNGTIELKEFLDMMQPKAVHTTDSDDIKAAFNMYDKDGNGYIDAAELRLVMTNLGEKVTESEVEEMIREADVNGDGQIEYFEFLKMLHSAK